MLKNYLKIAFRNLLRNKIFSFINIFGLSLGLTCAILIYLYVADELSYDQFHVNKKSLYRIVNTWYKPDGSVEGRSRSLPPAMGGVLQEFFPEFANTARLGNGIGLIRVADRIERELITFTDERIFEMFSFPLIHGQPSNVLLDESSLVLTESIAQKYFADVNPMGKTMEVRLGNTKKEFIVTGIAKDTPRNSSIRFNMLFHINNLTLTRGSDALTKWGDFWMPIYVQIKEGIQKEDIESKFTQFNQQYFSAMIAEWRSGGFWKGDGDPWGFSLQNIMDMHFDSEISGGNDPKSSMILGGIAFIVLAIACINFMNLSIGRSSIRSIEIGMRKVMGAGKNQLVKQFWSESLVTSFIALFFGMILANMFLPVFNDLAGKNLMRSDMLNVTNILVLLGIIVIVGILSGSYPALVMSAFRPVEILKGKLSIGKKKLFAKSLVIVQFSLSVFLIISTIIMGSQIEFLLNKDLGYNKEGLIRISIQEGESQSADRIVNLFKQRVAQDTRILNMSASNVSFGRGLSRSPIEMEHTSFNSGQYKVDYDYLETIGLSLEDGRNFSKEFATDSMSVIVNKKFIQALDIDAPLGKTIGEPSRGYPYNLKIIGVVDNYNFRSLQTEIQPVMLHMVPYWRVSDILVRISSTNVSETVQLLENVWQEIQPEKPFLYSFMDEDIASEYDEEKRWAAIVRYSSIFAVFIACMGIFGLTLISVSRRIKEIGIRKVLGAKVPQVIHLVVKEFSVLVVLANVLAWPIAYYVMHIFLQEYYYRINITPQYFLFAGGLSLLVAFSTTMFLALKAAYADPTNSLRYE